MFYLLEFDCDNSVDILNENCLIFDNEPQIGETVRAVYKKGKKQEIFEATVVNKSENFDLLKNELDKKLRDEETGDPSEMGKGKRLKRKTAFLSDDEEGADEQMKPKKQTKMIKSTGKTQNKLVQQKKTAKDIMNMLIGMDSEPIVEQPSTSSFNKPQEQEMTNSNLIKENEQLKEEIRLLKTENKRLRKERSEALECHRLMAEAQKIVDSLKTLNPANAKISQVNEKTLKPANMKISQANEKLLPEESQSVGLCETVTAGEMEVNEHSNENEEAEQIQPNVIVTPEGYDDHLLFKGNEEGVCRLVDRRNIFVLKEAKKSISQFSKNQTVLVRSCLTAVFTQAALESCSVKGNQAKGPLGRPHEKRKGLYPEAINAIIEFSNQVARERNIPTQSNKELVSAMATRLCEIRAAAKKASGV